MIQSQTTTNYPNTYVQPSEFNFPPLIERGWLCPRCNRVNAPHVSQCPCTGYKMWTPVYADPYKWSTGTQPSYVYNSGCSCADTD